DDDPLQAGPAGGEADVGLRRIGRAAHVRVVDRADLPALLFDLLVQTVQLHRPDLELERARVHVLGAVDAGGGPRRALAAGQRGDDAAALDPRVLARVGDDLGEQLAGD